MRTQKSTNDDFSFSLTMLGFEVFIYEKNEFIELRSSPPQFSLLVKSADDGRSDGVFAYDAFQHPPSGRYRW
ncbi:unnamed protein product [Toxocara canis]|uniref:FERM domain-containing protein n=1 Tax=Toxocara canis TaxID=6265 RepID=A0A183UQB3_TOXCA|nr:unnamed protein product [Toxocara canis]